MRRIGPPDRFTVQVSTPAWEQISHLPADAYRSIREELESLAAQAAGNPGGLSGADEQRGERAARSCIVGEYVVLYDVDTSRRSVTLLEIARRLPQEG